MKILTAAEMAATDRRSADEFGVSLADLMEQAGAAVAAFCLRQYPAASRITVLCGKGNNGGDGMVAARMLDEAGRDVRVALLGRASELKHEAARAFTRLQRISTVQLFEVDYEAGLRRTIDDADLLIDAVVGTGFKPPLGGLLVTLRDVLLDLRIPVVAVDLPSGWDADSTGQDSPDAFRADAVVTFTAPKFAHVFGHLTTRTFGPVVVASIGSPPEAIEAISRFTWAGASKSVAEVPRGVNSNKGRFGHILIAGGSYGKAGAPSMASLAALRAGAGLVTAAVPQSILNTVSLITPELMVRPLLEIAGTAAFSNLEPSRLESMLEGIKVLAVGPGLSTLAEAPEFARQIVLRTSIPVVIDADALNAFADRVDLLNGTGRTMVLTPHPGEMARLLDMTVKQVEVDRANLARRFATEHLVTLVLKGWRTLIAHPDGSIAVNTTGNPAMAKGGSGDILTGIIAAMLGQFPGDPARAVEAGVYLHGLAADFAAQSQDEHTVLATDTLAHLSDAFRYRTMDADGLTWLTGIHP